MLRTYGRTADANGVKTWVEVTTDAAGNDDMVWVTTLIQVLKLSPGESPFFANYGVPSTASVMKQLFPDYYMIQTQRQFSQYFSSLLISKATYDDPVTGVPAPYYNIAIITHAGVAIGVQKIPL